jgi:hypothetical protein
MLKNLQTNLKKIIKNDYGKKKNDRNFYINGFNKIFVIIEII